MFDMNFERAEPPDGALYIEKRVNLFDFNRSRFCSSRPMGA